MNDNLHYYTPKMSHMVKFIIMSSIGVFLFVAPIPDGKGAFNIPLGFAINWIGLLLNSIQINGLGFLFLLAMIMISLSLIVTVIAYTVRPAFIIKNEMLQSLFLSHPVYFVSKIIAVFIGWMVYFGKGPEWLIGWEGGRLMMDLIAGGSSGSNLMSIFIILGITIPLLTDFGIMEFLGILIKKGVRFLFTLPGRSSVDLLGSWFSSSAASVIITRTQHEQGFYTGREAAAICVNFTLVSLPFTYVVASTIDLSAYFGVFYLIICVVSILLAIVMPRIWPLRGIKDEYLPSVGKQIDETVPKNVSVLSWAGKLAGNRASKTTAADVIKSGVSNWLSIFMDLIPVIMAWGTIALILEARTPLFDWLSWPFGWFLHFLRVEEAFKFAPVTIVGFIDMFIPAILLDAGGAPLETRFILGILSIVQVIYLAETGILILKSKIPLHIGHLLIIFIMRTVFALPLIVLFTRLLFRA